MVSIVDRVFRRNPKQVVAEYNPQTGKIEFLPAPNEDVRNAMKSLDDDIKSMKYNGHGWSIFDSMGGLTSRNRDITYSEQGAAQAYGVISAVYSVVSYLQDAVGGREYAIYDGKTNEPLVSSTDRNLDMSINGAVFMQALRSYEAKHYHDFLQSIVLADWLFGENYVWRLANTMKATVGIRWLNPLAVTPDIQQGKIAGFRYSADDGYDYLKPEHMAYRIYKRNPFEDLRGISPILVALDEINIERNAKRAIQGYFRNGMILGGMMSPKGETTSLSPAQMKRLEEDMRRKLGGVGNAYSWPIAPAAMEFMQFQVQDIDKHYILVEKAAKSIHKATGVPEELAGNPESASYENADKVEQNWWRSKGKAYTRSIAEYINTSLLPHYEPDSDCYFAFDYTDVDRREAALVHADLTSGIIDIATAAAERGYEVSDKIKEAKIMTVNGQPYTEERLLAVADGQALPEGVTISGELSEDGETITSQGLGSVPTSEVFGYHIDSGIVTVNEARSQLGLLPMPEEQSNDLQELQAKLSVMVTATQAMIPPTVAAQMVGLDIPTVDPPTLPAPKPSEPIADEQPEAPEVEPEKHIHFDGHDISVAKFAPAHDDIFKELAAWQRVALKNHEREFEPHWLRGDIGDALATAIRLSHAEEDYIKTAFDAAKVAIETYQKAIQATRLDFEKDYDNLLSRARDEKLGRVQWASAMRSIVRRYGNRAFSDGLIKGGVLDGTASEEDQNRIAELYTDASPFITKLGDKLYKEGGITDVLADNKAAQWWNRTMQIFFDEGLLSADKNGMYEFAGVVKEKSCPTCRRMKGQRHRLKDYARKALRPRTDGDNFECGGFECDDKLTKVQAKARGNW